MKLIRWNPVTSRRSLSLQDDFNNLFDIDRVFNEITRIPFDGEMQTLHAPAVDIEETQDEFIIHADLPGMSQKDVKVSLLGDTLTLRGERKRESTKNEENLHRTERMYGSFERTFKLGRPVSGDQVRATYKDGVLEVRVPKAEEARMREIEVQVG